MSKKHFKNKKNSLIALTKKYTNAHMACVSFFINAKWSCGFYCEKCGCIRYCFIKRSNILECTKCMKQHYLFVGTIFEKNKIDLYKLIFGLYLFFSANKGYSAIEMAIALNMY